LRWYPFVAVLPLRIRFCAFTPAHYAHVTLRSFCGCYARSLRLRCVVVALILPLPIGAARLPRCVARGTAPTGCARHALRSDFSTRCARLRSARLLLPRTHALRCRWVDVAAPRFVLPPAVLRCAPPLPRTHTTARYRCLHTAFAIQLRCRDQFTACVCCRCVRLRLRVYAPYRCRLVTQIVHAGFCVGRLPRVALRSRTFYLDYHAARSRLIFVCLRHFTLRLFVALRGRWYDRCRTRSFASFSRTLIVLMRCRDRCVCALLRCALPHVFARSFARVVADRCYAVFNGLFHLFAFTVLPLPRHHLYVLPPHTAHDLLPFILRCCRSIVATLPFYVDCRDGYAIGGDYVPVPLLPAPPVLRARAAAFVRCWVHAFRSIVADRSLRHTCSRRWVIHVARSFDRYRITPRDVLRYTALLRSMPFALSLPCSACIVDRYLRYRFTIHRAFLPLQCYRIPVAIRCILYTCSYVPLRCLCSALRCRICVAVAFESLRSLFAFTLRTRSIVLLHAFAGVRFSLRYVALRLRCFVLYRCCTVALPLPRC